MKEELIENYKVYMHRNKINSKLYFGITSQNVNYRWNKGKGYLNQKISRDIEIFGWDSFEHTILFENMSKKEAEKIESELIIRYHTYDEKYGYNVSKLKSGGFPCSDETKQKISNANSGTKNGMFGKNHSNEVKQKISDASKRMWKDEKRHMELSKRMMGKNNPNYGKKCTPEKNESLRKLRLGKPAPNRRKVICINTGKIYDSVRVAEIQTGVSNISCCCNGKRRSCGGLRWRFYE